MSSPFTLRGDVSSPPISHAAGEPQDQESMETDVQRRFMRVKVLYTFDDQNKTNCLARLPNPLSIATVYVDDQTQIGLIELKDCIEAIVAASPEIITRLQNDYTVYAYDFSEYETPLVGQGLLSRVLALASPTPAAPASQSRTMITGRVCKNILGLFSNGIKETLEVKLKLVPVPSCAQSEYLKSMEQYRNMGAVVSDVHPGSVSNRSNSGGVESINQLLYANPNLVEGRRNPSFSYEDEDYGLSTAAGSVQGSRAGSPTPSIRSCGPLQQVTQDGISRPSSRTSIRSDRLSRSQRGSIDASHSIEQSREEGPVRKRARITQTNWRGRSSFGTNSDSLRVTASTAASIRVHRPVAINPAMEGNTDAPPRAPTPRPDRHSVPQPRGRPALRSSLRHASSYDGLPQNSQYEIQKPQRYVSPYPIPDELPPQLDSAIYSGEDEGGNTPSPDFPSSPPEYAPRTTSLAPSSPGLPTLPHQSDSGFMSDAAILLEEDGGSAANPEPSRPPANPTRDFRLNLQKPWKNMLPGPESLLPTKILPRPVHHRQMVAAERRAAAAAAAAQNAAEVDSLVPGSPGLQPRPAKLDEVQSMVNPPQPSFQPNATSGSSANPEESFTNQLQQQATYISAPSASFAELDTGEVTTQVDVPVGISTTTVKPRKARRLQRTDSNASQVFYSDGPCETTIGSGSAEEPRSGSGAKRKKTIQNALAASLAAGAMPQFCSNCGEVNTPTWRKAFTKVEQGAPDKVQLSNEKGGIIGYEVLSKDDCGVVTSYRIYKKNLAANEIKDNTMETLLMCNPCGIWFHTKGTMRPPELWVKNPPRDPTEKKPRRRQSKKKGVGNDDCPTSDIYEELSSALGPGPPSAMDGAEDLPQKPTLQPLAPRQPRASSVQPNTGMHPTNGAWNSLDTAAALKRAIQSSPARFLGSQQSPIELDADLTPQPVRRLLFPSPRKEGEVKSLEDSPAVSPTKSREQATQIAAESPLQPDLVGLNQNDKENCPPLDDFDGLAHLFEASEPSTPRSSARSSQIFADLLKTPTPRSTRTGLTPRNSSGRRNNTVGLLTPSRKAQQNLLGAPLTPFTAQLNQLLSDGFTGSPSKLFDFPLPTFDTPNKSGALNFGDFGTEDLLGTDLPMPSSPPGMFSLYEDPNTSTAELWSGTSIFDGGAAVQEMGGAELAEKEGVAVDFAAVIEQVVGRQ